MQNCNGCGFNFDLGVWGIASFCPKCGIKLSEEKVSIGPWLLFLDVDGVLNTWEQISEFGHLAIGKKQLAELARICSIGVDICLSSSWRLFPDSISVLRTHFAELGINLVGKTVDLGNVDRCEEIAEFLSRGEVVTKVKKFAILDDSADAGFGFENNFFQTNHEIGLTKDIADRVIAHFRE